MYWWANKKDDSWFKFFLVGKTYLELKSINFVKLNLSKNVSTLKFIWYQKW